MVFSGSVNSVPFEYPNVNVCFGSLITASKNRVRISILSVLKISKTHQLLKDLFKIVSSALVKFLKVILV